MGAWRWGIVPSDCRAVRVFLPVPIDEAAVVHEDGVHLRTSGNPLRAHPERRRRQTCCTARLASPSPDPKPAARARGSKDRGTLGAFGAARSCVRRTGADSQQSRSESQRFVRVPGAHSCAAVEPILTCRFARQGPGRIQRDGVVLIRGIFGVLWKRLRQRLGTISASYLGRGHRVGSRHTGRPCRPRGERPHVVDFGSFMVVRGFSAAGRWSRSTGRLRAPRKICGSSRVLTVSRDRFNFTGSGVTTRKVLSRLCGACRFQSQYCGRRGRGRAQRNAAAAPLLRRSAIGFPERRITGTWEVQWNPVDHRGFRRELTRSSIVSRGRGCPAWRSGVDGPRPFYLSLWSAVRASKSVRGLGGRQRNAGALPERMAVRTRRCAVEKDSGVAVTVAFDGRRRRA